MDGRNRTRGGCAGSIRFCDIHRRNICRTWGQTGNSVQLTKRTVLNVNKGGFGYFPFGFCHRLGHPKGAVHKWLRRLSGKRFAISIQGWLWILGPTLVGATDNRGCALDQPLAKHDATDTRAEGNQDQKKYQYTPGHVVGPYRFISAGSKSGSLFGKDLATMLTHRVESYGR